MKQFVTILLCCLCFICCTNRKNSDGNSLITKTDSTEKQSFPAHFFKVNCACKLEKEIKYNETDIIEYHCNNSVSFSQFSITIQDLTDGLSECFNFDAKEEYRSRFLIQHEQELKKNGLQYKCPKFYGFKSVEWSIKLDSLTKNQLLFVNGNYAYTLSTISVKEKNDSIFNEFADSFEMYYKSEKYGYTIEIPKGFQLDEIRGKNVDYKCRNKYGNSIVIVINKLTSAEEEMSVDDLLNISDSEWQNNSTLPNFRIKHRGNINVDNQKGVFIQSTSKVESEPFALFHTHYMFIFKGYLFNLTTTCEDTQVSETGAIFNRAIHSFVFPK